jgi:hypothetical protein
MERSLGVWVSNDSWDEEKTVFGRFGPKGEAQPDHGTAPGAGPKAIFRLAAIQHHITSEKKTGPIPLLPMWAGVVTWAWIGLIAAALAVGTTVKVETTVPSSGIVQAGSEVIAACPGRNQVTVGDTVRIEAADLHWSEFGSGAGVITQVTTEGPAAQSQVHVAITRFPDSRGPRLGSQVTVRFVTDKRTPAAILLSPILRGQQ